MCWSARIDENPVAIHLGWWIKSLEFAAYFQGTTGPIELLPEVAAWYPTFLPPTMHQVTMNPRAKNSWWLVILHELKTTACRIQELNTGLWMTISLACKIKFQSALIRGCPESRAATFSRIANNLTQIAPAQLPFLHMTFSNTRKQFAASESQVRKTV